jgi:hypothetical protein
VLAAINTTPTAAGGNAKPSWLEVFILHMAGTANIKNYR